MSKNLSKCWGYGLWYKKGLDAYVDTEVEVLFLVGTGRLHREVEHAEFTELDLLAFEELLEHTALELVGDTEADVLSVDGVVL